MNDKLIATISAHIKKIFVILFSSSILVQGLYIYGLWFHDGYISGMGFDTQLFAIEWHEAPIWSYKASRYLSADWLMFLVKHQWLILSLLALSVYLIVRIWLSINSIDSKEKSQPKPCESYMKFKHSYPKLHKILDWFLIKKEAGIAFIISYTSMVFLVFLLVFMLVWLTFPLIAKKHGQSVAKQNESSLEKNLCQTDNLKWNQCISIIASKEKLSVQGRLIAKNGDLLGIYTKTGPVTITQPKKIYIETQEVVQEN